ncbi:MAG TPA: winged helix-turn-helix domain-containing protein [Bryobacteraceae bacterium]|jgi:Tol biopolymer transport system component/DNA-binding winged helix-turn-helix (wHTH) protein
MSTTTPNAAFRFGAFELDRSSGELRKHGVRIKLQEKPFQILLLLLERPGEIVSRQEIRSKLWPEDTFVDFENSISSAVRKLREALSDNSGTPRFVETISRRGYRFVAPVSVGGGMAEVSAAPPPTQQQERRFPVAVAVLLLLLLSGLFWLSFFKRRTDSALGEPQTVPLTSLRGEENFAAFSPDGKAIAYTWNDTEEGTPSRVYVKLVGAETHLRLTAGPGADGFPHWSPDGRYIAFCRTAPGSTGNYIVSALGGPDRRSTTLDSCGNLDWLPDGQHLVISQLLAARSFTPGKTYPLLVVATETGEQRTLTTPPAGSLGDASPLVSPNGKSLAFTRLMASEAADVYVMPIGGGQPRRLTFDGQAKWGMAWTADGREIVVAIRYAGSFRLWRVPLGGGEPRAITSGGENSYGPAIARQGNRLAYTVDRRDINLWSVSITDSNTPKAGAPVRWISSNRGQADPQYSPDGRKIAFQSGRSGPNEIWVSDSDGEAAMQLTHLGGYCGSPHWSPDGSQIAFDARPGGNPDIFVVRADGGMPRRVTSNSAEDIVPSWSRDGKWIYFSSNRGGEFQIWKAPVAGESPAAPAAQVTKGGGFNALESADSKYLYFAKGPSKRGLWRRTLAENVAREEPVLESLQDWGFWTLSPRGIYFFEYSQGIEPHSKLRVFLKFFDFESRQTHPLVTIEKPVSTPTLSPDGRRLVYAQVDRIDRDLMLVENFR